MNQPGAQINSRSLDSHFCEDIFAEVAVKAERLHLLTNLNEPEVLKFLESRFVRTCKLASFIQDNGVESKNNRGKFYGYRNKKGRLEGVALIGHTTLIEARSAESLDAFAVVARQSETPIHIMMSDGKSIETFWKSYAGNIRQPRLTCTELLFELNFPFLKQDCKWNVRLAEAVELEQIAEAQAEVVFIEGGVDPLQKDRAGFLKRCLSRIEKRCTFVVFESDKLVFKADIVAETSDIVYLEGIYVAPEFRGQGVGSRCLSKLCLELLNRTEYIGLLSNIDFKNAHRSFLKAGFKNTNSYTIIFV